MKKIFALALMMLTFTLSAQEISGSEFLALMRNQQGQNTFGRLSGTLQHKKSGQSMEEYPVSLDIALKKNSTEAVLKIDKDVYILKNRDVTRHSGAVPGTAERTGLRPDDLTMGFLFYRFVREDEPERVSAIPCRVLILESPDSRELVRVYAAKAYAFTLRAEFFNSMEELEKNEPVRTLETRSFKKKNGLYYAELLNIYGREWMSRIHFTEADLGNLPSGSGNMKTEEK